MVDRDQWFDSRLVVFVIWGIFVILFICIPSKRLVQRIFQSMGFRCCRYHEEEIAATNNNGGREMNYENLCRAKKEEMDNFRASHISYQLHPFSLTLEEKHMLRRTSDTDSPSLTEAPLSSDAPLPQDRNPNTDEEGSSTSDDTDVEKGFVRGTLDPPENDNTEEENKQEEENGDDVQYTHVSIPPPGHNFDNVNVLLAKEQLSTEEEKNQFNRKEEKKGKIRLFGAKRKSKGASAITTDSKKGIPLSRTKKDLEHKSNTTSKRRECSIFCAICLMEYEPSERISWSSNPDCTHVFHEDCIVQWLVSLGRTKSKMQRFCEDPTEAQLLNYELECPCCRQEFIERSQCDLPEVVCGEERV